MQQNDKDVVSCFLIGSKHPVVSVTHLVRDCIAFSAVEVPEHILKKKYPVVNHLLHR